ncbi:MAG TPA: oxidoreductase family protein [Methylomirabilota bacterium]|nr:oxidoreductase family protein [Methylomirabilota bacterium]
MGPTDVITDAEQVTPAWLTRVLKRKGVISSGKVARVGRGSVSSMTSSISRLEIRYSGDVRGDAPQRLLLKCFVPDDSAGLVGRRLIEAGRREVEFYNVAAKHMTAMSTAPVVRCIDARYSPERSCAHVLLEDVSDTHSVPPWPLPPLRAQCEQAVDALARCHAFWWEDPRLGETVGEVPGKAFMSAFVRELEEKFPRLVDLLGDRLPNEKRKLYERFFSSILPRSFGPKGLGRASDRRAITLVHGDGNWWNFLYPRDPAAGRIYVIDWQAWHVGVGTDDMVDLIGLHLDPERRHALETDLLKRYHAKLLEEGVDRYGWADCWDDYRESAIRFLAVPVWQWAVGMPVHIWWPSLNRILQTCADLHCEELLSAPIADGSIRGDG